MTTTIEYALMAGHAYLTTRGEINWFPVPQGWTPYFHVPDPTTAPIFPATSGFEALAFQSSTEIVISYAGTYDKDLTGDIAADAGLAAGTGSAQLLQAVEYYLQVKAANPGASISLTGHSLGGGLASLVGVFFGVSATTFDQAPFAQTALFQAPNLKAYLASKLDGSGNRIYSDAALAPLTSYIDQKEIFGVPATLIPNADLVSNIVVAGEMLSVFPGNIPNRIGITTEAISNSATGASAGDLHSQALLTAFLQSRQTAADGKALNEVTVKLPDLLKMLFDTTLFAHRTDEANDDEHKNIIEHLVRHEAGVEGAFAADAMLSRFTRDLWKLAQDGGLTLSDGNPDLHKVSNALIAFAMQKYYEEKDTSDGYKKDLFSYVTGGSGGLQFDLADVSKTFKAAFDQHEQLNLDDAKGFKEYFGAYLNSETFFTPEELTLINALLPSLRDWYVQAGTDGLNATDSQNRGAFLLGGSGSDKLTGGSKADLLLGNGGNDRLSGGKGSDLLLGGTGNDTYVYSTGDGLDTVLDADGSGSIVIDGDTLSGGAQYGDYRVHRSADGQHLYAQVDEKTLVIDGNIIVNAYNAGDLCLSLTGAVADPASPQTTTDLNGDREATDFDPATPGIQSHIDDWGNVIVGDTAEPDRVDHLHLHQGNNHVMSGGGNDVITTLYAGDDLIEAGAGRDSVSAGAGKDLIQGGADGDILDGGAGDDRIYADTQIDAASAIAQGNAQSGSGQQGDWLAGGSGDDMLVGSNANDVLTGGDGADLLMGGAGNDDILGDTDWVAASFNWTVTDRPGERYFFPTTTNNLKPTRGAADVVYAGAGNDHVWGEFGNDLLFGEGGNDYLDGGEGNDILLGGAGADLLTGDNSPAGTAGDDYLDGGAGDDALYGGAGQDIYLYNVGDGIDTIHDNKADNNLIRFGAGVNKDNIKLNLGSLLLDLGNGDAIHIGDFDRTDVFNSSVISGFQFADGSSLSTKELLARGFDIDGTVGDDSIIGTDTSDRIKGFAGNDDLVGQGGADTILGGDGNRTQKRPGRPAGKAGQLADTASQTDFGF